MCNIPLIIQSTMERLVIRMLSRLDKVSSAGLQGVVLLLLKDAWYDLEVQSVPCREVVRVETLVPLQDDVFSYLFFGFF